MALFHNALPAGFEFDGYRVERVLGAGAFGITYLAQELNIGRKMAIKEYLPSDIAMRSADGVSVHAIRSTDGETYEYGLEQFVEEARTLVRFQHPNIVPFHRLVEANGTAYVVMEYQEGRTLAEVLKQDGLLDEARLRDLVLPLLDALDEVHRQGFLHRDIKPDNIFVREDGRPMLIDFGAAREALSRHSLKPTAILTPGYAPFEQYSSEAQQGPYTDIYAMGATIYRAAFGRTPPEATTRTMNDTLVPAMEAGAGRFDDATLVAVDAALNLQPGDRPQTIADLRNLMAGGTIVAAGSDKLTNGSVSETDERSVSLAVDTSGSHWDAENFQYPVGKPHRYKMTLQVFFLLFVVVIIALFFQNIDSRELSQTFGEILGVAVFKESVPEPKKETESIRRKDEAAPRAEAKLKVKEAAKAEEERRKAELLRSGRVFKDCDACPKMVVIPSGTFTMGSPAHETDRFEPEGPQHQVAIQRFAIGQTEVTFAEWDACVTGGGCKHRPGDQGWGRGDHPVVNVSWNDAIEYAAWLSRTTGEKYRLPSEAEWEYAARAGTKSRYWWGDDVGRNRANCNGCGSRWDGSKTAPVAQFGANPFGLYDMHGNVREWTQDCYRGSYAGAPRDGSARTTGDCTERVNRGGDWYDFPPHARSAVRSGGDPAIRGFNLGFRVARTLP